MTAKRVAVLLAPGFEEIEAVTAIDILRRAGVEVRVAGTEDNRMVAGSHGIAVGIETTLATLTAAELDAVVLPGGMPGAANLKRDARVLALVREMRQAGKLVAAICAAPIALAAAGVLAGRKVTAFPSVREQLTGAVCTGARVEFDGGILTGVAAGAAIEFSLALLEHLGLTDKARTLRADMLVA